MPLIRCPSCKTVFSASDACRGTVMACPFCARPCRIPVAATKPQPPQQHAISRSPSPVAHAPEDNALDEVDELEEVGPHDELDADESPPPRSRERNPEGIVSQPDDEDDEIPMEVVRSRPRQKKRRVRRRDGDLGRVNLGLGFYYASILSLLGGLVVALLAFGAGVSAGIGMAMNGGRGAVDALGPALALDVIAYILINWVASILGLVGSALCLWAPEACRARGFSIASMVLNTCAIVIGLFRAAFFLVPAAAPVAGLLVIPAGLMTFIAWCLFMVFLRQLSIHLGEGTLAADAIAVMLRGIAILVAAPVVFLMGLVLIRAMGCAGLILFLVGVMFGLYGVFLFLRRQLDLIGSIRQVIASRY